MSGRGGPLVVGVDVPDRSGDCGGGALCSALGSNDAGKVVGASVSASAADAAGGVGGGGGAGGGGGGVNAGCALGFSVGIGYLGNGGKAVLCLALSVGSGGKERMPGGGASNA
eukprot:6485695-Amphidinium_carterae.1